MKRPELVLLFALCCHAHAKLPFYRPPLGPYKSARTELSALSEVPLIAECDEKYRTVALDHFSWVGTKS